MAEQVALGFGDLLRQLRAEAGLTQEELAEAAGLSPRSVSDLERGIHATARKDTAELLAGALGLAESVSGGLVAARLTSVPGASDVFRGSIVSYASQVKFDLLGVSEGPVVSPEAAAEMALASHTGLALAAPSEAAPHGFLFGEDQGRYLVAVDLPEAMIARAAAAGVAVAPVTTTSPSMNGCAPQTKLYVPGVLNRQLPAQPGPDGKEGSGGTAPEVPDVCTHDVG